MGDTRVKRDTDSDLRLRIGSSIVLGVLAIVVTLLGGIVFVAAFILLALLAYNEWLRISGNAAMLWLTCLSMIAITVVVGLYSSGFIGLSIALIFAMSATWIAVGPSGKAWGLLGLFYVIVPTLGILAARNGNPDGFGVILFLFSVVWATDVFAYFGGQKIGGPKLWPRISPAKTWAGALCGLLGAVAAGALIGHVFNVGSIPMLLWLALILSIASQVGDLTESAFKRRFNTKDSGSIIPGHGGVLDRVDGLYGAAALVWLASTIESNGLFSS